MGGLAGGFILAIALPFAMYKDLYTKVKRRDQDILIELPELLNRIVLLVEREKRCSVQSVIV